MTAANLKSESWGQGAAEPTKSYLYVFQVKKTPLDARCCFLSECYFFLKIRIYKITACFSICIFSLHPPWLWMYKYRCAKFPMYTTRPPVNYADSQRSRFCAIAYQLQRPFRDAHVAARPRSNGWTQKGINSQHFFSFSLLTHSVNDNVLVDQGICLQI